MDGIHFRRERGRKEGKKEDPPVWVSVWPAAAATAWIRVARSNSRNQESIQTNVNRDRIGRSLIKKRKQ
jgi:hypothetical protein